MTKTLLTLGAGPGIGLATARRFVRDGYRIALAARNQERLEKQAATLRADGAVVETVSLDVSDAAAVGGLVQRLGDDLDVLHYNAGVLRYDAAGTLQTHALDALAEQEVEADIRINITGALYAVRAAMAGMKARRRGTILLTGGGLALSPSADLLTLSVGKAGLRTIAQGLFEPLKAHGVHIAVLNVATLVSPDSPQSLGIADSFWRLHAQRDEPSDGWAWEASFA